MSKVLIDRALLERAVYSLELAYETDTPTVRDICAVLATPSGTPAMPVKAYYHEWTDLEGVRTRSVGLEVRKEFADAPLVLEADALARVACLEGEIAKRDARIAELEAGPLMAPEEARAGIALQLKEIDQLRAELAATKAQEPSDHVRTLNDALTFGIGMIELNSDGASEHIPAESIYAAPVSEAKRSAAELFSDVLMCQRNQVETLAGDPYMVGLHNGMSMMIANFDNSPDFECLSVSEVKAQGVVMPERLKPSRYELHDAAVDAWNSCLDEVARLNAAPVQQVSVPDGFERYRLANKFCEQRLVTDDHVRAIVVDAFASGYGFGIAAAPAAPAADAGIVDMYRHLQKVTPYRFKKIQDASITDGGDVMYFHKDRFDAALLADMAAHRAQGVV